MNPADHSKRADMAPSWHSFYYIYENKKAKKKDHCLNAAFTYRSTWLPTVCFSPLKY